MTPNATHSRIFCAVRMSIKDIWVLDSAAHTPPTGMPKLLDLRMVQEMLRKKLEGWQFDNNGTKRCHYPYIAGGSTAIDLRPLLYYRYMTNCFIIFLTQEGMDKRFQLINKQSVYVKFT